MSSHSIVVKDLRKTYKVPEREAGLKAAIKSLVARKTKDVHAVDGISFHIEPGEIVGFLGPNGAGKTTTLKMLSGLLYPTAGELSVAGHLPQKRERDFLQQITLVMGQRSQLNWDIPAIDSYDLYRAIYGIPHEQFQRARDEMIEIMQLKELVKKPVRNLSLGERMKAEMVGALLHQPNILFLDEPTIGLDVTMQRRIRAFIQEYNQRTKATVLLTSHYMADVQALCKRVIVIHHGKLLFDGDLTALVERFSAMKTLVLTMSDMNGRTPDMAQYGTVVNQEPNRVVLRVAKADAPQVTARLLADLPVTDLTVDDPPIEEVIESVFATEDEAKK
ncbi:MAG TPA: ATP-binding cassette domain-containing protein [Anaerolineales bacterium]|nr:ATP-binding cassette domain-containing protein [Anaerolineales bacterium]HRQ91280.1 ATP-binding cassette domain-containing protein [Anaerolineales bacterium]